MPSVVELLERSRLRRGLPDAPERRAVRERSVLTQHDIADAVGVTASTVSRWESGTRTPRGDTGLAYAELLNALMRQD